MNFRDWFNKTDKETLEFIAHRYEDVTKEDIIMDLTECFKLNIILSALKTFGVDINLVFDEYNNFDLNILTKTQLESLHFFLHLFYSEGNL